MSAYKAGLTFDIGIGAFWQENFDLRLPKDYWKVLNYIHQNPVKAGFVEKAEEYLWSSACGRYDVSSLHSLDDVFTRSSQM